MKKYPYDGNKSYTGRVLGINVTREGVSNSALTNTGLGWVDSNYYIWRVLTNIKLPTIILKHKNLEDVNVIDRYFFYFGNFVYYYVLEGIVIMKCVYIYVLWCPIVLITLVCDVSTAWRRPPAPLSTATTSLIGGTVTTNTTSTRTYHLNGWDFVSGMPAGV